MPALDCYDLAIDQLKSFTRSSIRTQVMLCLMEGSMSAADLGNKLNIRVSTVLHALKQMIEDGQVNKSDLQYSLTNIGKIHSIHLDELTSAIVLLDRHKDYWLTHDLSAIPDYLLSNIGMLVHSQTISSDATAPLNSLDNFMVEVSKSEIFRGFSSFIIPGFAELVKNCAERGIRVELILTDAILKIVSTTQASSLMKLKDFDNVTLYHYGPAINIGFTVTESLLALGLYRTDGRLDLGSEIICIGKSATEWGNKLFEYYKKDSELLKSS